MTAARAAAPRKFGGSVLDELAAKTGPAAVPAQLIPLDAIEEDPDQPRRHFDQTALEMLAASIRLVGMLQPVGVRQTAPGRYRLTWGARRLRAARLAGRGDIPAVLAATEQQSHAAKVIENQQRVQNSNSELAAAVARMTSEGMTNADIATVLALSDPQSLKHYRVVAELPPELARWTDRAPVRALYELYHTWRKGEAAQETIIAGLERAATAEDGEATLSITEARRIVAAATGKHAGSFDVPPEPAQGAAPSVQADGGDPAAVEPAPKRTRAPVGASEEDVDAERVARVKAWLADPARPRPPLNV
jgi:ParB family transcriptional regulator, chromosome partitioning protein